MSNWGDIAALASAGIAVASAGIAAWQAGEARKARKESARWAEDSANASVRSADAAERSLALQEAAARAAEPPKVAWRIEHAGNWQFRLRNIGTDRATGVRAEDCRADGELSRDLPDGADIGANQAHTFVLIDVDQYPMAAEVWVTWDGASEPVAVPVPPS